MVVIAVVVVVKFVMAIANLALFIHKSCWFHLANSCGAWFHIEILWYWYCKLLKSVHKMLNQKRITWILIFHKYKYKYKKIKNHFNNINYAMLYWQSTEWVFDGMSVWVCECFEFVQIVNRLRSAWHNNFNYIRPFCQCCIAVKWTWTRVQ